MCVETFCIHVSSLLYHSMFLSVKRWQTLGIRSICFVSGTNWYFWDFSNELTIVLISQSRAYLNVVFEQNVCTTMCNSAYHLIRNTASGDVDADAGY